MKKTIISLITSVVVTTGFSQGIDAGLLADGLALGNALGVPTNGTSQIWTNPVFSTTNIISTNSFLIRKLKSIGNVVDFDVSQNNAVIATGMLFECDSFDAARSALLRQMVMNNMLWNSVVPYSIVQTNTIGEFCITEKVIGTTNQAVVNPSSIDFVRGAKAIRLYRNDNVNIHPIAETLDELLKR